MRPDVEKVGADGEGQEAPRLPALVLPASPELGGIPGGASPEGELEGIPDDGVAEGGPYVGTQPIATPLAMLPPRGGHDIWERCLGAHRIASMSSPRPRRARYRVGFRDVFVTKSENIRRNFFRVKNTIGRLGHSMNFGQFYGTFYVEVATFQGQSYKEKIPLLDIFVEEKKKRFCLENGHLLMPAFWVVNLHRNQRG